MTTMLIAVVAPDPKLAAQWAEPLAAEHQVEICPSARALMDLVDRVVPNVVIVNIMLPDANGLELCAHLKADRQTENTKTIAVSSFRRVADFAAEAREKYLVDSYLEQPISADQLRAAVDLVLERKPSMKAARQPERVAPDVEKLDKAEDADVAQPAGAPDPFLEPEPTSAARPIEQAGAGREADETGKIGPILLPELLLKYYSAHASGLLDVRSRDEQREILLRDGVPTLIRTNFIADDALGQLLVSRGMLDPVALEMALQSAKKSGDRLGEILVSQGVIGEKELQSLLRAQAKRKMNSAFRWKEGTYAFTRHVAGLPDAVKIDQDFLSILIAGVARHYDMAKLEERLYSNKAAVVERAEFPEISRADLRLTEREWHVLELVDGVRTLGDVIAEADLNFARTFQVLYLTLLFGIIRFRDGDRFLRVADAVAHRARTEAAQHASGIRAAGADGAGALANSGSLAEVFFGRFLFHLFRTKATGQLRLERGDDRETIFLQKGVPVKVLSARPGRLALGEILISRAGLDAASRDRALARAREEGRQIGDVLLAEHLVTPHQLFEALTSQLEDKLLALFGWTQGQFHFDEGVTPESDLPPLNVELTRLLLRGMRENVPIDVVRANIEPIIEVPLEKVETDVDLTTLFSDPREQRMVGLIDGRRNGNTIIRVAQVEPDRGLRLLFALRQLGLIAPIGF